MQSVYSGIGDQHYGRAIRNVHEIRWHERDLAVAMGRASGRSALTQSQRRTPRRLHAHRVRRGRLRAPFLGAYAKLGKLDAVASAAGIELPRGRRINAVSPSVITKAMKDNAPLFRGHEPVSAARAALAYAKSVEGARTGQVFRVL